MFAYAAEDMPAGRELPRSLRGVPGVWRDEDEVAMLSGWRWWGGADIACMVGSGAEVKVSDC